MSDLEKFLKHNVEDYLLEDLETLKSASPPAGRHVGGVGYPLLITTFAGIELVGNLVSSAAFDPFKGAERFAEFWRGYLYPEDPARAGVAAQLYKLDSLVRTPIFRNPFRGGGRKNSGDPG